MKNILQCLINFGIPRMNQEEQGIKTILAPKQIIFLIPVSGHGEL
jgi:hypothetical protein